MQQKYSQLPGTGTSHSCFHRPIGTRNFSNRPAGKHPYNAKPVGASLRFANCSTLTDVTSPKAWTLSPTTLSVRTINSGIAEQSVRHNRRLCIQCRKQREPIIHQLREQSKTIGKNAFYKSHGKATSSSPDKVKPYLPMLLVFR